MVGTRIRVAAILTCYRQGMSVEEIVQQYPHLRPSDVHDALAYAYEHLDDIEADLAADDEEVVKAKYGLASLRSFMNSCATVVLFRYHFDGGVRLDAQRTGRAVFMTIWTAGCWVACVSTNHS